MCYICMKVERERMFKLGTKWQPAFISGAFTNWKDSMVAFIKHLKSGCHGKAVEFHELPKKTSNVGEKLCAEHKIGSI